MVGWAAGRRRVTVRDPRDGTAAASASTREADHCIRSTGRVFFNRIGLWAIALEPDDNWVSPQTIKINNMMHGEEDWLAAIGGEVVFMAASFQEMN